MAAPAGVPTRSGPLPVDAAVAGAVRRALRYHVDAGPERLHRGLPSPWLTMVLSLADPIPVGVPEGDRLRLDRYRTLVGGLHTRSVLLPQSDEQAGIQLDIHPFASRALFGVPAGELAGQVVELVDMPCGWSSSRAAALLDDRRRTATGAALGWVRSRVAGTETGVPREVVRAWRLILSTDGGMRIRDVAAEVGWSRRHLTDQIRHETGLGAKDLARIARFSASVRAIRCGGFRSLSDIAADCGYVDQAHLAAEWREFVGCAPSGWIAEELQHLQAVPPPG